ncbi:helix-turn-helix domain-containing protein [Streptomyces sp. NPDC003077]|uniref:helix-turn-helix domain-containing protein n=1 Tax=Streptomyces sp. NPDC003077 TaxID=3154443 RepID=UPI0033A54B27
MPRWKELPAPLDHRARQLVVQMRRLKDHSGLSLIALAAKTAYSKSSWERYLNGRKLPPKEAVEALARACGADPVRLLALHEVAAAAWPAGTGPGAEEPPGARPGGDDPQTKTVGSGGGEGADPGGLLADGHAAADRGTGAGDDPGGAAEEGGREAGASTGRVSEPVAVRAPGPYRGGADDGKGRDRARRRGARVGTLAVGVAAALLGGVMGGVLVARPWQAEGGGGDGQAAVRTGAFVHEPGQAFRCHVRRTRGVLSAGRSDTTQALLGNGAMGWPVVEAQCLLLYHGHDPGIVDGIVGENTMRAVKRFQTAVELPADGIVGPDTWGELRR